MKQRSLPYRIVKPPRAIQRARLDNLALVPASMLPLKGAYQPLANTLPEGSVLICDNAPGQRIRAILAKVATFFRSKGHQVKTLPAPHFAISSAKRDHDNHDSQE
jgi:hypothetical protein